jgi:hypothetical protein
LAALPSDDDDDSKKQKKVVSPRKVAVGEKYDPAQLLKALDNSIEVADDDDDDDSKSKKTDTKKKSTVKKASK